MQSPYDTTTQSDKHKPKELNIPGGSIVQKPSAQGVSSATAALYSYVMRNFTNPLKKVLELGSGSGVLSIMLSMAKPDWQLTGVEIQSELHSLAVQNATKLQLPITFINGDLRSFIGAEPFDLIVANPPWQKLNSGILSPNPERAISRSEVLCSMPEVLESCQRNLLAGGFAVLLYPFVRQIELCEIASKLCLDVVNQVQADRSSAIFHLVLNRQWEDCRQKEG